MFDLFAEAVEDLYTGIVGKYVRKTPALWEEFVMKLENGDWYLVDPDPTREPNDKIFVLISTTTSDSHLVYGCGQWEGNCKRPMRSQLQELLQNLL